MSIGIITVDNVYDVFMNSKHYEGRDYGLDLDLLIISNQLHVSYPRRSELVGKETV